MNMKENASSKQYLVLSDVGYHLLKPSDVFLSPFDF